LHQYNVGAPFEMIAINIAESYTQTESGNQNLLIAIDSFTKWPEVYAIPNQVASTVEDALVTDFFCHFGDPRELHRLGPESRLMQDLLPSLGMSKKRNPLYNRSQMTWWNDM
jgi:hypothetical protein